MASYSDTDGHSRVGDVVEIVTPAGVTRRIDTLDHGWRQLLKFAPKNDYLVAEYDGWQRWRQAIADSYMSRIFAKGTLSELDQWTERYEVTRTMLAADGPIAAPTAALIRQQTIMDVIKPEPSSYLYIAIGISAIALGIAIFSRR